MARSEKLRAEALGEGANLGVLDYPAAQIFFGGLQHGDQNVRLSARVPTSLM
jgi:hypothetical protein